MAISSRVLTRIWVITRLRNHFRSAGITYHGACSVDVSVNMSAKAAW